MQLAILAFSIVLFSNLLDWLGKEVLTSAAYKVYTQLVLRSIYAHQRSLKQEILNNKNQLQVTSSQDAFAKWAKLRRKVDKGLVELEEISELADKCVIEFVCQNMPHLIDSNITSHHTRFKALFGSILSVCTSGAQWIVVWWFRRNPVFWMPAGWMPGAMEWMMSFGGVTRGSVSVTMWLIICKRVAAVFIKAQIESLWKLLLGSTPDLVAVQSEGSAKLG